MKSLILLISLVLLTGCYPTKYGTMIAMEQQFREECNLNTLATNIDYQDDTIKFTAVCRRKN